METLRETQLTKRATRRPCEYNYTNADIHSTDVQPSDGYQFEYPVNWAGDPSTNKVIGLRRISYKASSVNLAFNIKVKQVPVTTTTVVDGSPTEVTADTDIVIPITACYTSENTFEECWMDIAKQITDKLKTYNFPLALNLIQSYNKDTGEFTMSFETSSAGYQFEFNFSYGYDYLYDRSDAAFKNIDKIFYKCEFLKLLNQPITKTNVDDLHSGVYTAFSCYNVWNRDSFYCHASFSDSPRKIIGINKDFWPTPSVFYEYSDNSNDFNIYFTTDTVHSILPRHGVLLIQLSYIFNYQTSYLTY